MIRRRMTWIPPPINLSHKEDPMFRHLIPPSCFACGADVPRSAAGRCPICRTEFVAATRAATSPRRTAEPAVPAGPLGKAGHSGPNRAAP